MCSSKVTSRKQDLITQLLRLRRCARQARYLLHLNHVLQHHTVSASVHVISPYCVTDNTLPTRPATMTSLFPEGGQSSFTQSSGFSSSFLKQQAQNLNNFKFLASSTKKSSGAGGYLAFPPTSSDASTTGAIDQAPIHNSSHVPQSGPSNPINMTGSEIDDTEKQKHEAERKKRIEKEREIATEGEFEWVRSGGVLRDAQGRRDKVRTESIKQEIRLREREKRLTDQWDTYERNWHTLLESNTPVSFKDVPWPLPSCPSSVEDLSFSAISEFLLEPLEVRTNTVTQRERIRTSLLRWHPDKISDVLERVVEDDVRAVREGIGAVFVSLKRMKEH